MKNKGLSGFVAVVVLCLMATSCATKKNIVGGGSSDGSDYALVDKDKTVKTNFLRKVYDNEVFAKSISSKIKFTINAGSKDISVSGSLKMKKDEVIRIQLSPLDLMEVGRIEFAPEYVLFMDRINKEYVKVGYGDVDFLKRNGLDFYALQALFWNSLFVPGTQKMTDSSLKCFDVSFDDALSQAMVSLIRENMSYKWTADKETGLIKALNVTYSSRTYGNTSVVCDYGKFKPLNRKSFPTDITLALKSRAMKSGKTAELRLVLNSIDTDDSWETNTKVPGKYKRVSVHDVINRIL